LDDERFIDGLMEDRRGLGGCVGPVAYTGWYPSLFYRTFYWDEFNFAADHGAGAIDPLVVDVHTDVLSVEHGDPGSVLHEAVGRVTFLMIAVDNGNDRFVCAGPVLSHFEFELLGPPRRLSDAEWGGGGLFGPPGILDGKMPPGVSTNDLEGLAPPVWTQSYLVPNRPK